MPSVSQAVLLSWSVPPAASFVLVLTAVVYGRGWFLLRRARVPFVPLWRAICFLLGLFTLWVALASPLDTFSAFLITAHMLQHMLLMMVAPPLLLLGAPVIPLVRGLPVFARREFAGPFLNWRLAQRVGAALTNLWVALILMGVAMFAWHTPRLYELALASSSWHEFEHACFFVASLIFWWPVAQPWPSRSLAPRWAVVPYLLVVDLQNTILSAVLVFSDRVLYPSYTKMPRLFGFSAMQDQAASGAIMWVMGSLAFVVPAVVIAVQCLSNRMPAPRLQPRPKPDSLFWAPRFVKAGHAHPWLQRKLSVRKVEAVTFIVLFAAAGLGTAMLASRPSDDDDQALRLHETSGPFAIAVFAAPGELPAGTNSFAVLVQDQRTQDVLPDATVDVRARRREGAQETNRGRASAAESENKLLQSADLDLRGEGDWSLTIMVSRGPQTVEVALPLKVVKAATGFTPPWPYVVLAVFAGVLWFSYLRRRRARRTNTDRASSAPAPRAQELELPRRTR